MTVQGVTYYRTACDRANCTRHSGNVGRIEAFPSPDAALDDWLLHGGTVDPATGVTLCDWHAHTTDAPATAEPPPVPQADGHPDPPPPVAGPGEPETQPIDLLGALVASVDRARSAGA